MAGLVSCRVCAPFPSPIKGRINDWKEGVLLNLIKSIDIVHVSGELGNYIILNPREGALLFQEVNDLYQHSTYDKKINTL